MTGIEIMQRVIVIPKNKYSTVGTSLDIGTNYVSMTRNMTSVRITVERYGTLSPLPLGKKI